MFLVKYRVFHPILFKILIRKKFLEKDFDSLVRNYSRKNKDFLFVQIGANDGIKADPIYLYVIKYHWKGILVEPVKYIFEKLKKNYQGIKGLNFENAGIGKKDGYNRFYRLKRMEGQNMPLWYDEIGSFVKSNVLKHKDKMKNIEDYLMVDKVPSLTLISLFKKYKLRKIDLLVIDAEGFDYHIVKQIPFKKIKPSIIVYESRHLSKAQKKECLTLLRKNGYSIMELTDTVAFVPIN